ncbi:MAG: FeoA domain-containing protein [Cycloclasticus sp.]|nr:FeoA domain-containing protein [Cycloclasticus sp.]
MSSTTPTTLSLADIKIGEKVMLCKKSMDQKLKKKLLVLGFSTLMPLQVTQRRKGGLVVGIGNARIALNEALAQQVLIEAL